MIQKINFSKKIINWYKKYGRKTLPWQINKTPYTIWISEIMLQQTQVIRVIPYFQRFIYEFPNVKKLATSKLDTILHIWSGLGYYARAHNLHKTAKIIVNKYNSIFPNNLNTLINLPGIGRSTAGAILSLSLKQKHPILDSNVKRILTRYYTIHGWPGNKKIEKELWTIINNIIPNINISKFNQGLMDLGETICTTILPKCNFCPLKNTCQSKITNTIHLYPNKKPHKKIKKENMWLLILKYKDKVWITKRPLGKIWGGLFSFPQFSAEKKLHEWMVLHNLKTNQYQVLSTLKHKFSHYSLNIVAIKINLNNLLYFAIKNNNQDKGLWFNLTKPQIIGFPQPMIKLLKIIYPKQNITHTDKYL